jgi:MoaE-MoaD fusion protein
MLRVLLFGGLRGHVRVAVNHAFADAKHTLSPTDEVALIPPVAGGAPHPRTILTSEKLSVDRALGQVTHPRMGGVCIFVGVVRDHANGKAVQTLDYSAYDAMALATMEKIVTTTEAQHAAHIACHHRVGHLVVGDLAVVIAAAAPHRGPAFDACRQVIEALKQDVPIFKKETGPDGSIWVGMGP